MVRSNKVLTNTVGGELSPLMYGRADIPIYQKGLARCENWIVLPQGGARFRNGTAFVKYTRLNQLAVFIPFQFSDQQSYLIEATNRKFRFFKDNAAILEAIQTITAVTQDAPGVVTSAAHGYADGDEIFVSDILGMQEINAQFFLVANATTDTFTLQDIFGNDIDTTPFGAYVSGGSVGRVYEIDSPYLEIDLPYLQYAQNADTMYITNQRYEPLKLTRAGHADWTLTTYTRTNDPFTPITKNITGVTAASPGVVTATAHGFVEGQEIWINDIVGMAELNQLFFTVHSPTTNTFQLIDADGNVVDTSAFTAYTSGGKAFATNEYPAAVCFIDSGRLMFGGTRNDPETIWGSKAPSSGNTAFDNFTNGVNATDGITFTLAPIQGRVDSIQWMTNTAKFILIGTFAGVRLLYGATLTEPISPTSVTAKAANAPGVERALPVSSAESLFFIQRGAKALRSLEYDFATDSYITTDRNLVADHLTAFGMLQIAEQIAQPDVVWTVREDGRFIGLTFKEKEDISGWHRHYLGGNSIDSQNVEQQYGKVLWSGVMPRPKDWDQIWFIVERTINGNTARSVEYMTDLPLYPIIQEFFSGNIDVDTEAFKNAMYESQKDSVHLDMASFFDGTGDTDLTIEEFVAAPAPPALVQGAWGNVKHASGGLVDSVRVQPGQAPLDVVFGTIVSVLNCIAVDGRNNRVFHVNTGGSNALNIYTEKINGAVAGGTDFFTAPVIKTIAGFTDIASGEFYNSRMVISSDSRFIYLTASDVTHTDLVVLKINCATGNVDASYNTGKAIAGGTGSMLRISADNNRIYMHLGRDAYHDLYSFDAALTLLNHQVVTGPMVESSDMSLSTDGSKLVVIVDDTAMAVMDTVTFVITYVDFSASFSFGAGGPFVLRGNDFDFVKNSTSTLWIATQHNNAFGNVFLSHLDVVSGAITEVFDLGANVSVMVRVDPITGYVYASDAFDNAVYVYDPGTAALLDTVAITAPGGSFQGFYGFDTT